MAEIVFTEGFMADAAIVEREEKLDEILDTIALLEDAPEIGSAILRANMRPSLPVPILASRPLRFAALAHFARRVWQVFQGFRHLTREAPRKRGFNGPFAN